MYKKNLGFLGFILGDAIVENNLTTLNIPPKSNLKFSIHLVELISTLEHLKKGGVYSNILREYLTEYRSLLWDEKEIRWIDEGYISTNSRSLTVLPRLLPFVLLKPTLVRRKYSETSGDAIVHNCIKYIIPTHNHEMDLYPIKAFLDIVFATTWRELDDIKYIFSSYYPGVTERIVHKHSKIYTPDLDDYVKQMTNLFLKTQDLYTVIHDSRLLFALGKRVLPFAFLLAFLYQVKRDNVSSMIIESGYNIINDLPEKFRNLLLKYINL